MFYYSLKIVVFELTQYSGKPKVAELDLALSGDENILWFDISVYTLKDNQVRQE